MLFDVIHIGNPMFGKYHMVSDVHMSTFKTRRMQRNAINSPICYKRTQYIPLYSKSSLTLPNSVRVPKLHRLHIFYIKHGKETTKRRTALNSVGSVEFQPQRFVLWQLLIFITSLNLEDCVTSRTNFVNRTNSVHSISCCGFCETYGQDLWILNQLCVQQRTSTISSMVNLLRHYEGVIVEIINWIVLVLLQHKA